MGAYDRLQSAFQLLEDVFFRTGFQAYRYDTFLAQQWMQGATLKQLISNQIQWKKAGEDSDLINDIIRDIFDDIENKLRYRYVKYMRVYNDVLRAVLVEMNRKGDAERVAPIHLYLEYGASNITLINLIALGLSRTSAILLKTARSLKDDLSATACQNAIERIDLARTEIPAICRAEIKRLRRRA
jgi:hypothetical protein